MPIKRLFITFLFLSACGGSGGDYGDINSGGGNSSETSSSSSDASSSSSVVSSSSSEAQGQSITQRFEGTLVEGSGLASPARGHDLGRDVGEGIGGVRICAYGRCSTTNANGQWNFSVERDVRRVEYIHESDGVLNELFSFSVNGGGLNLTDAVIIPANSNEIFLEMENHIDAAHVHTVIADGLEIDYR